MSKRREGWLPGQWVIENERAEETRAVMRRGLIVSVVVIIVGGAAVIAEAVGAW